MRTFTAHRLTSASLLAGAAPMLGCATEDEPIHGERVAYAESVYW